jgi:heat shock protein HtpX
MSILLLIAFPGLVLFGIFTFLFLIFGNDFAFANLVFIDIAPYALAAVGIWFLIAYFIQERIIKMSTNSRPLDRDENLRVYNLTENLCISVGMKMPKLFVIDCPSLNAFASGIDEKSYSITLTTGLIAELDNSELEGVIAHELTHIRNKDVQLLIISIIFVGIFAYVTESLFRTLISKRSIKRGKDGFIVLLIAILVSIVVYFFSILFKFALSRRREYLADAGAVELTKNARALASALRKISVNSDLDVKSEDLKQAFIENSPENSESFLNFFGELFNTHPPIKKRIEILENGL